MKKLCNYILFRESNWNGPEADKSGVTCSFLFGSGWFKPEHPADCISFVDIKFRTELEVDFIPFVASSSFFRASRTAHLQRFFAIPFVDNADLLIRWIVRVTNVTRRYNRYLLPPRCQQTASRLIRHIVSISGLETKYGSLLLGDTLSGTARASKECLCINIDP
ncbi:uncharacterized protein BO95DRAFT_121182 [Aspergillus brunneoviolaceus CBS 621.78]|uniref:Uncharacterized protein n=1 Tax=Aspergillus brunneoviolaceus CBS 621.78 TaxID=1450534 RepID=A0ACD1GA09_9EURO|nr:hypothetical protein BO95DRAFT_121182 [Aspergillus brunneoviolaceus CBS 621.78]RAH46012.1 hypothetical protein BO95DRAFT_121182 [Aspergillus brunneoviolaceus CBS 621.78]